MKKIVLLSIIFILSSLNTFAIDPNLNVTRNVWWIDYNFVSNGNWLWIKLFADWVEIHDYSCTRNNNPRNFLVIPHKSWSFTRLFWCSFQWKVNNGGNYWATATHLLQEWDYIYWMYLHSSGWLDVWKYNPITDLLVFSPDECDRSSCSANISDYIPIPNDDFSVLSELVLPPQNLICELVDFEQKTPFSISPTHPDEITFYSDPGILENEVLIETDKIKFYFESVKNFRNWILWLTDDTESISFLSENVFFWDNPTLTIESNSWSLTNLKLFMDSYPVVEIATYNEDRQFIATYSIDNSDIVTFEPARTIVVHFWRWLFTQKISKIIVWSFTSEIVQKEFCTNEDTGQQTFDWEIFLWDSNNLPLSNLPDASENSRIQSTNPFINTIISPIDNIINNFLTDYIQFYDINIPTDYEDLFFDVPVLSINENMQITLETKQAEIPQITDNLNVVSFERNEWWAKFIVFLLALLYISTRFILLWLIFSLFLMLNHFLEFIFKKFTGLQSIWNMQWNVWTWAVFLWFLSILFFTAYISIFTSILPIIPFFNHVSHLLTVFFSFFANLFWEYIFFASIVNAFFTALISAIWLYIVTRMVIIFGKLN